MRDSDFNRGDIPMTKSEIRAVALSKLDLNPNDTVYDIGAGTGSVSVEAARYVRYGHVYAFEETEEGCDLIRANAEKFGTGNITVIPGHAPETFAHLPAPDCAFIGGSRGGMKEIAEALLRVNPDVRIVADIVTLETLTRALRAFSDLSLETEVVCVSVSRAEPVGSYHMMKALNPVYILSANERQAE